MAIAINKGKIPKDYTVLIQDFMFDYTVPTSGTISTNITSSTNASVMRNIPPYYMVGEFVIRRSIIVEDFSSTSNLGWTVTIDSAIMNKFRFIRFVVVPMIRYVAPEQSGNIILDYDVYFKFSVMINGSIYRINKLIQSNLQSGQYCTLPICAFIFDTKTKDILDEVILDDTSDPSVLWSDI